MKIKLKGIRDFIIEAVCIPSVCTPLSNQQCNKVVNVFPHFRNLKFADNINEQNKKIDLLIRSKEGEPVAQNTFFGWVLSGDISTFDSKNPSFTTSMQTNTSPISNLSTEFENEVFEKESLGISEHHRKIFSNKNDNFIENEKVFTEFKKCVAFENN